MRNNVGIIERLNSQGLEGLDVYFLAMLTMQLLILLLCLGPCSCHMMAAPAVCSVTHTNTCHKGHVIYEGSSKDYCLSYNPEVSSSVILYPHTKEWICSVWTIIPNHDHTIQMMLEDRQLFISEDLQMFTIDGGKFKMKGENSAAVTFDTFNTSGVTLSPLGRNCIGAGDTIAGQGGALRVVLMSFFQQDPVSLSLVPACPSQSKLSWRFHIPEVKHQGNKRQQPSQESFDGVTRVQTIPEPIIDDKQTIPELNENKEKQINIASPCSGSPCKNGGECVDDGDGASHCDCSASQDFLTLTGYTGQLCQTGCDLGCVEAGSQKFKKCKLKSKSLDGSQLFCEDSKCVSECSHTELCAPVTCMVAARTKSSGSSGVSEKKDKSDKSKEKTKSRSKNKSSESNQNE